MFLINSYRYAAAGGGTITLDDFNDGSQAAIWTKTAFFGFNASVTVVESGGVVTITPVGSTAGSNMNGYQAISSYGMSSKYVQIEIPSATPNDANVQLRFGMLFDATNFFGFIKSGTGWTFRVTTAGTPSDTTLAYDSTAHRWVRLEQSGTDILFRTAPDGSTWTTRRTVANPSFGVTTLKPFFLAGTTASVAVPGNAVFDNFSSNL